MAVQTKKPLLKGLAKRIVSNQVIELDPMLEDIEQAKTQRLSLVNYLIHHASIPSLKIAQAFMQEFRMPLLDLGKFNEQEIPNKHLKLQWLQELHILPIYETQQKVYIAIADPLHLAALDTIRFTIGKTTEAIVVEFDKLEALIHKIIQGRHKTRTSELDEMSNELLESIPQQVHNANSDAEAANIDDTPIVRFVNQILMNAIDKGASDLHFEPYEKSCRIRFRIDGLLHEATRPPQAMGTRIVTRLKVIAKLDIAERRIPQDGKIKFWLSKNQSVNMRINTCPTVYGEKVVIRILDANDQQFDIDTLGLDPQQAELYQKTLSLPHGMILVTGPTGSGKTVTLYSGLKKLNCIEKNLVTVEDPVEISMPGINQVNINPQAGLSFSTTLRAFLRQDPDVIMIGEIRDLETAEIAIKAAQTGHLVLSTLHTNSAEATINRLIHMGIAPFNLISSINLIIAQRLMRKLCQNCKKPHTYPQSMLKTLGFQEGDLKATFYRPHGCNQCTDGYKGRVGVYQVLPMTDALNELILKNANSIDLGKQAQKEGVLNLSQAAMQKILAGLSTIEEMERVVSQSELEND